MNRLLLVTVVCSCCMSIAAQTGIEKIERYTIVNGLSNNNITSILQDKRGFLWIGTEWGLNRYDGRIFKQYLNDGSDGLPSLSIYNIAEDKEGILWVGTGDGICSFNPFTEKFTHYSSSGGKVFIDKENNIWFNSATEFCLLNRSTNKIEKFPLTFQKKETKSNNYILSFFEDSKNRFWIGTSFGVKLFDRKTKTTTSYHYPEEGNVHLVANNCLGIFEDYEGIIWTGTWGGGLLKLNERENKFENFKLSYPTANDGVNTIFSLNETQLNDERVLLATTRVGLVLINPAKSKHGEALIEQIIKDGKQENEFLSKYLSEIYKDKSGCFWIGSSSGLHKIDLQQQAFKWISLPVVAENNRIFHVVEDFEQPQKKMYLTTQQGWWKMDVATFAIEPHKMPALHAGLLNNLNRYIITKAGYWFTSEQGFGFYNPVTQEVKDLTRLIEPDPNKPIRNVRTGRIVEDDYGKIWLTYFRSGIKIIDPISFKVTSLPGQPTDKETLNGKTIYDFKKAPDGSIWVSVDSMLYQINQQNLSFKTYLNFMPTTNKQATKELVQPRIFFDNKGKMLLITTRSILEFSNQKLFQLYPENGLTNMLIEKLTQDNQGNYWVQTNNGFYKVSNDFKQWINFTNKTGLDGMADVLEISHTSSNHLIVPSKGRLLYFNADDVPVSKQPIPIVITSVKTKDTTYYFPTLQSTSVNISYTSGIEIELSATSFSNEKENKILYKLEGWDDGWKELVNASTIRYEQLPSGSYTLLAKAVNNAGIESKENATLVFFVTPAFWKTWWFILLCLVVVVAGIYTLYRYRLNQIVKEERLRSKIATDLHDDIGSTLSSISFYSETIRQQTSEQLPQLTPLLNRMGESSREMVGNMSDIVWAINPTNDDIKHLATRIQTHAATLCSLKNIQLQFECNEEMYSLKLSMERRQNIFLLFKEAINNALKYAECSIITVQLSKQKEQFFLLVKDNGIGFEKDIVEDGNGLINMQKRAKDIGGICSITSKQGNGTSVEFTCSIT